LEKEGRNMLEKEKKNSVCDGAKQNINFHIFFYYMEPHMCSLDTNKKKRKESHEKKTES
jgi:hypothetical protein